MRKSFFNISKNQNGASALLIVMGVGAVLASFVLSLQMYIGSRARIVARVRLAYKYTFIMEDAAKIILNGRLEWLANAGACGGGKTARNIGTAVVVQACLPTTPVDRCLNGEACICDFTQTDNQCATMSMYNVLPFSKDTMVALRAVENDHGLAAAFDKSIFESLLPDFDKKYVAFVDRIFLKNPNKSKPIFDEASAAANSSYRFAPTVEAYGTNGAPVNDPAVNPLSPYPSAGPAYTWRSCGGNRCLEIRVCVQASKEQALGNLPEACFYQKISHSFLWDHTAEPCLSSACPAGDPDLPAAGTKGAPDCATCPWRPKF